MTHSFRTAMDRLNEPLHRPGELCAPFLDVFPISGVAVSTVGDFLGSETVSASDPIAVHIDELQFDLGEGPCWDALKLCKPVLEPDLRNHPRTIWPAFSPAILADEVRSIFAFPLVIGPLRIGAVDLYSVEAIALDETQSRQAGAMAGAVSRHVLSRALLALGQEPEEGGVYSRRLIHQATGVVLAQLNMSAADARLLIQGYAFAATKTMMQISEEIVGGTLVFTRQNDGIESSQ